MLTRALLAGFLAALCWLPALAAGIPAVTDGALEGALALADQNRPELEAALSACQGDDFRLSAMRFLIANSPLADLGVLKRDYLIENLDLAIQARGEFAYCTYDDATWAHYVLPLRVSQEPLTPWRSYLHDILAPLVKDCATIEDATKIIGEWYGKAARFQQTQTRDQSALATLRSGYGRCEELVILWLCACRSVGIPSRQSYCPYWAIMDNNHAWWEDYLSGGGWQLYGTGQPEPLVVSISFGLPGELSSRDGALYNESGEEVLLLKDTPGARFCLINSTPRYRDCGRVIVRAEPGTPDLDPKTGKPYTLTVQVYNYGAFRQVARLDFKNGWAGIALGFGDYIISTSLPRGPEQYFLHLAPGETRELDWAAAPEAPSEMKIEFPTDLP